MTFNETLPQPAAHFRGSYCSYCIHERHRHINDGECERCLIEGNGFWPRCPRMTRTVTRPAGFGFLNPWLTLGADDN